MEHNKDIGQMVKETVEQGVKSPQASLWQRLDDSLEKREKKRRRALWFWYSGTGILLLLFVGVWGISKTNLIAPFSSVEIDTIKNTTDNQDIDPITTSAVKTNEATPFETPENTQPKILPGDTISATTTEALKAPEQTATTSRNKISEVNKREDTTGENGFKIKTKHAYYNSDIDSTVVSTNKQKIDSLMQANKRMMAIRDSIARARATDSVKLNESRKDSIPE